MKDAKVITVPPPQMVANMRVGNMDGFCVGEPWNHRAIIDGIGITAATTQDIWKDHPEKVLGTTGEFVKKNPNTARAVVMAVLEAGRWIDASLQNKNKMAETIADKSYVNTSVDAINQRILGRYQNGLGKTWDDPNHMKFFNDGAVNYPYLSDGMWFLTQHKRWGLLKDHPDYLKVAKADQPDRALQAGRGAAEGQRAQERHAQQQVHRRRGVGRQGPGQVRRRLQGHAPDARPARSTPWSVPFFIRARMASSVTGPSRPRLHAAPQPRRRPAACAAPRPQRAQAARDPFDWRGLARAVLPPLIGMALLVGIWALLTQKGGAFPTPAATFDAAVKLFADPFYRNGPNDQGIGWNMLFSLERVAWASAWRRVVGIPLGFMIGRFALLNRMVSPLISLLKPVSPLAWLPIGLLVFKAANPAAIWTIFIC